MTNINKCGVLTRTATAIVVIGSMFLTSCVSTAVDPANMTSSEIALRQRQTEDIRIAQGVVTGAAVGAAGGALIAALAGGDGRAIARGAIAGGLVGGVVGGVDANNVNQATRVESGQQDRYRQVIANADRAIAHYRRTNATAASLVSSENTRVARLNAEFRSGKIDKAGYRRKMANAKSNVAILDSQISRADRDISDLRSEGRSGPTAGKIAELQAEKSRLQHQRDALKVAYSRVTDEIDLNV